MICFALDNILNWKSVKYSVQNVLDGTCLVTGVQRVPINIAHEEIADFHKSWSN